MSHCDIDNLCDKLMVMEGKKILAKLSRNSMITRILNQINVVLYDLENHSTVKHESNCSQYISRCEIDNL